MLLKLFDLSWFKRCYGLRSFIKLLGILIMYLYRMTAIAVVVTFFLGTYIGALWIIFYGYWGYYSLMDPTYISEV